MPSNHLEIPYCHLLLMLVAGVGFIGGCETSNLNSFQGQPIHADSQKETKIPQDAIRLTPNVVDFDRPIMVFESVFWEPADTESLRQMIRSTDLVRGKRILEIGTGTGLIALCCERCGAEYVVATDVNPQAIRNAQKNVEYLECDTTRLEFRLVPTDNQKAFAVIGTEEKFDVIISNPPWEDAHPQSIDQFALYDTGFELMQSMLKDYRKHLRPNGRLLLAYGCVDAIKRIQSDANEHGLAVTLLDDRELDSLPNLFLPGMLLEICER